MEKISLTTVKSKWARSIEEIFPRFAVDNENESVIKLIQLYLSRDPRFETVLPDKNYSLNKGIILHGSYGTGKTLLMKIAQRTAYFLQLSIQFKRLNMRELCQKYQADGPAVLMPENKHWFVDEFGLVKEDEPRERVNSFGNKVLLGDEMTGVRYDRFQSGFLTHLTTNLTYQQINDYYTGRTVSRLHEMCNFIPLDGKDRRLTAKPQPPTTVVKASIDKKKVAREWWEKIKREHVAYKNGGVLMVVGAMKQFSKFEEVGLITIPRERKYDWIAKAKKLIKGEKDEKNSRFKPEDLQEFRKIKSLAQAIEKGILSPDQENEIRSVAATMAIEDFYSQKSVEEFEALVNAIIKKI